MEGRPDFMSREQIREPGAIRELQVLLAAELDDERKPYWMGDVIVALQYLKDLLQGTD